MFIFCRACRQYLEQFA